MAAYFEKAPYGGEFLCNGEGVAQVAVIQGNDQALA
jgi:hypothetical protein